MIDGQKMVKIRELKQWSATLTLDNILRTKSVNGDLLNENSIKLLSLQLQGFKQIVDNLRPGDNWTECREILSPLFYQVFFKHSENSIKIANYFECLIKVCDISTYKKLFKGYDYKKIGEVLLYDYRRKIGSIGVKSDLLWSVLYDNFIIEDKNGEVIHLLKDSDEYLSIQIWNIHNEDNDYIKHYISNILAKCSLELGLNFKVVSIPEKVKDEG